jgi:streptogramin lyase
MLQNLCSVLNYSVKPAERPVVEPLSPIAQFNHRAFVSPDRALILFWEMDGERVGLPNYPGKPTDFVVSDAGFAAPCEFDLLTGEVRGIDYSECGSSTVVRGCLVRPYPKALVLLKPSQDFIAAPTAASPSPKWKHLNSSSGLPNDWVTSIAIDGDSDELWVGTYNCGGRQGGNAKYLSRIRRSDYSAEHFGFDDTRIDQTPSRILIAEPFVWAATRAAGLGRYDRAEKQWKLISSVEDEGWGTLDFVDMAQAHGALWVANLCGGLGRLDLSTAHWATFTETRYRELTGGPPVTEPNDLPRANRVVAVIAEGPGVYAATLSNGLSCLDLRTSQWCRVLTPDKLPNGAIWAAKAKEGKIWLAGTGGLCAYDTREQKSKTFLFPATTPMSGQRVVHLEFDGDGGVWAGTYYSGIARLDPEAGKYTLFEPSDDGLPNARLSALLPHHDKVWLGFWGAGVAAFDIAAGRFQRLSTHDGLLDDRVWTIAADPSSVYFGTYRGLSILRTSPLAIARAGQSPMAGKSALFTLSFVNLTGQPLSNIELKVEPGEPGLKVVPGALPAPNSAPPDTEIQAKCEVMIPASFRARQLTLSASLNAIAPDGKRLSFATEQRFLCTPPVHLKSHTPLATITNVESRLLELRIGWGFAEPGKCSVRLAGPETLEISPETRELGFTKDGEEQFCSFNLKLREGERAAREPSEIPIEADTPLGKLTLGSIKVNTDHLDTWMVIGPFSAADSGPGVSVKEKKALPPETEIDFSKTYQGRERGVAWRRWYKSSAVPEYDLDALMGTKKPGDNKESVVFLFTKIGSDAEREVELKVSVPQSQAPGGKTQPAAEVTVWLNKEIVVGRTEGHGTLSEIADVTAKEETPEEPGTESLDLPRLKKGESTILIKCLKHAEPWQLTLTFLDAKAGQPIPGLVFAP